MKKLCIIGFIFLCFTFTSCNNKEIENLKTEGLKAIEVENFDLALEKFNDAKIKSKEDQEFDELILIIEKYQNALSEYKNKNYDLAKKILNDLPNTSSQQMNKLISKLSKDIENDSNLEKEALLQKENLIKEKNTFSSKLKTLNDDFEYYNLQYLYYSLSNGDYSLKLEELSDEYEYLEIEIIKYLKSNLSEKLVKELTEEELLFSNKVTSTINEVKSDFSGGNGGAISIATAKIECYQARCERLLNYYF